MSESQNTRRDFMKTAGIGAAALSLPGCSAMKGLTGKKAQTAIPRWRGFNLLNFFVTTSSGERSGMMTREDDFKWIRDWGFDFVRLPASYPLWLDVDYKSGDQIKAEDLYKIRESSLEKIDRTVEQAQKFGIHLNLGFHRAPGYCVNEELIEPYNLWKSKEAQDAFIFHWDLFAKRYRSIPASQLSFNLVNEPGARDDMAARDAYIQLVRATSQKIRESTSDRIVFADGFSIGQGRNPMPEMKDIDVVQSPRGYTPGYISHYQASWGGNRDATVPPQWPGDNGGEYWDRERLERIYDVWVDAAKLGIGVHCGECGSYNKTPHNVVLAWMRDLLDILTIQNMGYALWEFRGDFGILDSRRTDVAYEDWYGCKLDRKLLELLQEF